MDKGIRRRLLPWAALATVLTASPLWAGDLDGRIGQDVKIQGVVVERGGDAFLLQNQQGVETEVRVSSGVEIQEKKKNVFRQGLPFSADDIVAGLRLEVEGYWGPSGAVEARKIKFTQDDLKVARVVDSRLVPVESRLDSMEDVSEELRGHIDELGIVSRRNQADTREARRRAEEAMLNADAAHRRLDTAENEIGALDRRFSDLGEYDVREETTVLFKAGRTTLSPEAMKALDDFAASIQNRKGILLEVMGFASADGDAELNRRLSEKRAAAVMRYLTENRSIEPRHFVVPHGFGENRPVADNTTADGRVKNRRVEVRLLVNRALEGQLETPGRASYNSGSQTGGLPR